MYFLGIGLLVLSTWYLLKLYDDFNSDPIAKKEIRNSWEEAKRQLKGKNPFMEFQIPTATVKFKQGFGRLIRSLNDNGMCILTDPRLLKAQYGKFILDALPLKAKPYKEINEIKNTTNMFKIGA